MADLSVAGSIEVVLKLCVQKRESSLVDTDKHRTAARLGKERW